MYSRSPWLGPLVLSFGERISKVILYETLSQHYYSVSSVDATRLIIAENLPDNARILYEETKYNVNRLRCLLDYNDIVVVEGYIASTVNGHTVTLGRGGSDYTATTLSALLRANSLHIYTNVLGILSGDPELIENPRRIQRLDYDEAYETSVHGVKRLHPRTFEPLRKIYTPRVYIGSLNDEYTTIGDYRASHIGLKIVTTNTTSNASELTLIGWYIDKQGTLTRLTEYLSEHDVEYNAVNFPPGRPLVKILTIGNDVRLMANILHDFIISGLLRLKYRVGVLGSTGIVSQRMISLVTSHPWFELEFVTASEKSSGRKYGDIVKWIIEKPLPDKMAGIKVEPTHVGRILEYKPDIVFSALPSSIAANIEVELAKKGIVVVSNASSMRMWSDIPLINPEVNAVHIDIIEQQQRNRRVAWLHCEST